MLQGGSFAYLTPTAAITMAVKASRDWNDAADGTNHERFLATMREVQGGIITSGEKPYAALCVAVLQCQPWRQVKGIRTPWKWSACCLQNQISAQCEYLEA